MEQNYETANDRVVASQTASHDGALMVTLTIPDGLGTGDYYVKVYAEDGSRDTTGWTKVTVAP